MLERTWQCVLALAAVAATVQTGLCEEPSNEKPNPVLKAREDKTTVSVLRGEQPLMRYRHTDVPMKPYVDQLFTPAGVQVLRDSPSDHKHHHALMFALAADGVDFWAEFPQSGLQKQRDIFKLVDETTSAGVLRSGFVAQLDWTGPGSDKTILRERREVCALDKVDSGATLIEWQTRLEAPPGKDKVTLTGEHYFGLGMRFLKSMDGGRFFYADDKAGEIVRGDERLTPTKWCAYTSKADGKPVTVAVFDYPKNIRFPAKMFTMMTPFPYLAATENVWKQPIVVEANKPLDLRYAVAVWDGEVGKTTVEKTYQSWLKYAGGQ